jgi:hypothetical protein
MRGEDHHHQRLSYHLSPSFSTFSAHTFGSVVHQHLNYRLDTDVEGPIVFPYARTSFLMSSFPTLLLLHGRVSLPLIFYPKEQGITWETGLKQEILLDAHGAELLIDQDHQLDGRLMRGSWCVCLGRVDGLPYTRS